jgi:anaerobic ribonucleoside-triphosphate reductase
MRENQPNSHDEAEKIAQKVRSGHKALEELEAEKAKTDEQLAQKITRRINREREGLGRNLSINDVRDVMRHLYRAMLEL